MGRFGTVYASLVAIPFAFYGYAFHKACISAFSLPAFSVLSRADAFPLSLANAACALALAFAVYALGSAKVRKVGYPVAFCSQLLAIVLVGVLCYVDCGAAAPAVAAISVVAQAVGTIGFSALWIDLYAHLNPVRALFCNAVSILVAQALVFLTEQGSADRVLFMLFISTLCTAACYYVSSRTRMAARFAAAAPTPNRERFLVPYKAVAFVAAYSFAYGVVAMGVSVVDARYVSVIPAALVAVFVLVDTKRFDVSFLLRLAFPLLVCGCLLASFVPGFVASGAVLSAGFAAMELLMILLICTISYGVEASALWLFGILGATQFTLRYLGIAAGTAAGGGVDSTAYTVLVVLSVAAVVISTLMLMSEKSLYSFWQLRRDDGGKGGEPESRVSDATDDSARVRAGALAAQCALTDREIEVLYLLVQGKTNAEIAQDMFISLGTVKAHVSHIYRKCNVSGRKELLTRIG